MKYILKYRQTRSRESIRVLATWFRNILLIVLNIQLLSAQGVPWSPPSLSTVSTTLKLNCVPMVDSITLSNGDYIGIFNKSGTCFGLSKYTDSITVINVFGRNGNGEELKNGEKYYVKVWLAKENCIIDSISNYNSESPLIFSDSKSNTVNILNFQKATISYPITEFCLNHPEILPQSGYIPTDIVFSSTSGLNINSSTGMITPHRCMAGSYTVTLKSAYCINNNKVNLTINELPQLPEITDTIICGDKLTLTLPVTDDTVIWSNGVRAKQIEFTESANISYTLTNSKGCTNTDSIKIRKVEIKQVDLKIDKADCYQQGRINAVNQVITNGVPPYSYRLTNLLDNSVIDNIENVPEGIYNIEIINANGCALKYQKAVVVDKDCLNDKPVFTPNEDGLDDRYFINLEGDIRIFDRNGNLKRQLIGPCYFDGMDNDGRLLPMGTYLVVSKSGKQITLTIIR